MRLTDDPICRELDRALAAKGIYGARAIGLLDALKKAKAIPEWAEPMLAEVVAGWEMEHAAAVAALATIRAARERAA